MDGDEVRERVRDIKKGVVGGGSEGEGGGGSFGGEGEGGGGRERRTGEDVDLAGSGVGDEGVVVEGVVGEGREREGEGGRGGGRRGGEEIAGGGEGLETTGVVGDEEGIGGGVVGKRKRKEEATFLFSFGAKGKERACFRRMSLFLLLLDLKGIHILLPPPTPQ